MRTGTGSCSVTTDRPRADGLPFPAVERAARRLAAAARSTARVILFGSYARGDAGPDSDIDFLVIERDVPDRHGEMVRLEREVRWLGVPVDVVVVSEAYAAEWGSVTNTLVRTALSEGRELARSPAADPRAE